MREGLVDPCRVDSPDGAINNDIRGVLLYDQDVCVCELTTDRSSIGCLWNWLIADFADQFIKEAGIGMPRSCMDTMVNCNVKWIMYVINLTS